MILVELDNKSEKLIMENLDKHAQKIPVDAKIQQALLGHTKLHNPVIIIYRIYRLIHLAKYKEAGVLMINFCSLFAGVKSTLADKMSEMQARIIRRLFHEQHFILLRQIIVINFSNNCHTLLTSACAAFLISEHQIARDLFNLVLKYSKDIYDIAKANYYLAHLSNNNGKKQQLLDKCAKMMPCFWSILARVEQNKPLITLSIYNIKTANPEGNSSDSFLIEMWKFLKQEKYMDAINCLYGMKKCHFKQFSPMLISTIKKLMEFSKDKSCLYRIGILLFKYHGIIIEECFPIMKEFLHLHYHKKITTKEIAICTGIVCEESKFFKHSYYNLDNGFAVGVMQVAYREAEIMCKRRGWKYSKNLMLRNDYANVVVGLDCIRHCGSLAKNNIVFALYYYNAGHISWNTNKNFDFIDFNNLPTLCAFVSMVIGDRARGYIIGVMEHYMIIYRLIFHKLPSKKDIINL